MSVDRQFVLKVVKEQIKLINQGVTGSYPHTDNCYNVKVIDTSNNTSYDIMFFDKAEYELIKKIKEIYDLLPMQHFARKKVKLIDDTLGTLVDLIEAYGDSKYTEASDSAAMDAAGEDI